MKLLTSEGIRAADEYTILNEPISSIDLMERAAHKCVTWIRNHFHKSHPVYIFCGTGNNGGDGLALARMLMAKKFDVSVFQVFPTSNAISKDCKINLDRYKKIISSTYSELESEADFPQITANTIVVDALFGSGLSRPPEGLFAQTIAYLNNQRSIKITIDIPSGMFADSWNINANQLIFKADHTLTFQLPKISFFFQEAIPLLGKIEVLDIGLNSDFIKNYQGNWSTIDSKLIQRIIKKRPIEGHKGTFGHGLLIAGSYGMMGAAVLSAKAAIRSGLGLLTCHIPRLGYEIMQTAVPEALIDIDESDIIFTGISSSEKYKAIAVGPGLNTKSNTQKALINIIETIEKPLILDADALNIFSTSKSLISKLPASTILTPHPGEFDRLFGAHENTYQRIETGLKIASQQKIIIILKGHHTAVILPDNQCIFNINGNNGMATGGSGDVLTGILLSLLSQGYSSSESAILGVFIHGLAGDLAEKIHGKYGLTASDIILSLGKAFKQFENE